MTETIIFKKHYTKENANPNVKRITFYGGLGITTPQPNALSNFSKYPLSIYGFDFHSSEQAFTFAKLDRYEAVSAMLEVAAMSYDPVEAKRKGRTRMTLFNAADWDQARIPIMFNILMAKFSQNLELKQYLLDTGDALLIEATPRDKAWACGLDAQNAQKINPINWPGENYLGFLLMQVRDELNAENTTRS